MKRNWMAQLARQYEKVRRAFPRDRLMILFDIDGTILDMRYMVHHVLQEYDRAHGTTYFAALDAEDIDVHENQIDQFLARLPIPAATRAQILAWYGQNRWTSKAILKGHRPFCGVLEVIRWFQIQPDTDVGLNTGRPETIRADTLRSLNQLGKAYRVQFSDDLLYMNPGRWEEDVEQAKIAGIRYFQERGYRIFAYIDNEPEVLAAIAEQDVNDEILLLHADTISETTRTRLPARSAAGNVYDLTELIPERRLPRNVQFVWHGVNDRANLRQFLASDVRWAECDLHLSRTGDRLLLRHDSVEEAPLAEEEELLTLDEAIGRLREHGKLVKLDLKAGGPVIDRALDLVDRYGFDDDSLWFNGNVERLEESGFRRLAATHPRSIVQCPVDSLASQICEAPGRAKKMLDTYTAWGVNRFSIDWNTAHLRDFFDQMDRWGFEVNIYNVPDLETFLQAVLLMPRSVTADFNFPKWHYYGRGSGHQGDHYEYTMYRVNVRQQ